MRKVLLAVFPLLATLPIFAHGNPQVKNGGPHPQAICAETRQGWANVNVATSYGMEPFSSGLFKYIENDSSNIIVAATHFDLPPGYQPGQSYPFVPVFYTRIGWGGFYYITPGSNTQTYISNSSAGLLQNDRYDIVATTAIFNPNNPWNPQSYIAFLRGGWGSLFLSSPTANFGGATYEFRSSMLSNILPDGYNHMMITGDTQNINVAIWRDGWTQAICFTAPAMNSYYTSGYTLFANTGSWGPIPH